MDVNEYRFYKILNFFHSIKHGITLKENDNGRIEDPHPVLIYFTEAAEMNLVV